MDIRTEYRQKPIPWRCFDWEAYDYDTLDEDSKTGFGATEAEAIESLLEQMANLEIELVTAD
jgi:hypothetical protein